MQSTRPCTTKKLYKDMVGFVFCVMFVLPTLLFAGSFTVPYTFQNGQVADADQVNANFTALVNAVNNNMGPSNTATGFEALFRTTTGTSNTAHGAFTLLSNTTGSSNTAAGFEALYSNTTGASNTAVGLEALFRNTTGPSNTAVGFTALFSNTTGSGNIAVGSGAGATLTSGNNNIYLGHPGASTESNTMRLGNSQTSTFIAGIAGVPVSGSAVLISNTGQVGVQTSSARYKRDIQPMGTRSRGLLQLRPVTFRYKQDAQGERQYGLIAEEVAKVYPELVTHGANGAVESVRYQEVIPMLLNELQAPAAAAGGVASPE